jgi:hypothetical protein
MPRSVAGKAAREQKLSAATAWKRGHTGGRGRGKFRAQGRGGRGGRGDREWHGNTDAGARGNGADASAPDPAYDDDDDDDDPVAAVGNGDAYQALLASLVGSGDDPADDEFTDALAAREESGSDESDESDESEETKASEEIEDAPVILAKGKDAARVSKVIAGDDSDEDSEGSDDANVRDDETTGEVRRGALGPGSDEMLSAANEGDEEDEVVSEDEKDEDAPHAYDGHSEGNGKATHGLAAHLERVVDDGEARRLENRTPKFKKAKNSAAPDAAPEGAPRVGTALVSRATACTKTIRSEGRWEFDQTALDGGVASALESLPDAPRDLPSKLKERWNAARDPGVSFLSAKKQKRELQQVTLRAEENQSGAGGLKLAIDTAKAKHAAALAAAPAAPYASKRQAEFFELLQKYVDVSYAERASPGSIRTGSRVGGHWGSDSETPRVDVRGDGDETDARARSESAKTPPSSSGSDAIMDAYLLHAVSHVMRTRRRITKNNEALLRRAKAEEAQRDAKKREERAARLEKSNPVGDGASASARDASDAERKPKNVFPGQKNRVIVRDDVPRDQGFARPTVLILVPMRNIAGRVVRRLLELCPAAHGRKDAVSKLERFADDFGHGDSDVEEDSVMEKRKKKNLWVPDDHSALFRGNTDDHFRLGIKVTKASVRLYVDFFGSDILIASPLGERRAREKENPFFFFFFFLGEPETARNPRRSPQKYARRAGDEKHTRRSVLPTACGRTSCSLLARGARVRR